MSCTYEIIMDEANAVSPNVHLVLQVVPALSVNQRHIFFFFQKGNLEALKVLVALGAAVNTVDSFHFTPLDTANYATWGVL